MQNQLKTIIMTHIFNSYILLLIIVVFQLKQHYFNTQSVMLY